MIHRYLHPLQPAVFVSALLFPLLWLAPDLPAQDASENVHSGFAQRLDIVQTVMEEKSVQNILDRARTIAAGPVLERAFSMADMEPSSEKRVADSRAKGKSLLERKPEAAEPFALASGDMAASRIIMEELPLLAADRKSVV